MRSHRAGKAWENAPEMVQYGEASFDTILINQRWDTGRAAHPTAPERSRRLPRSPRFLKVAALVLLTAVLLLHARFDPTAVATRFVKASVFQDWSEMAKHTAYDLYAYELNGKSEEEYFEAASREYHEDISNWKELSVCSRNKWDDLLSLAYGSYTVKVSASRTSDLSVSRLEEACSNSLDRIEERTDFDRGSISKAKKVTVNVKIRGEDDSDRYSETVYMVKCGLFWKCLETG